MINQYLFRGISLPIILLVVAWTLFWKCYGVWTAVKNNNKGWFIALLIFNTCGILEIIYLFAVAGKKWSDVRNLLSGIFSPKKSSKKEKAEESKKEEVL